MLGNTALTAVLGAPPRPTDDAKTWVGYARSLASIGLPVMLVKPGTKRPADMRTERERAADDKAAAEAGLGHNTGGVHLATTNKATLKKYVDRALKPVGDKITKGHPAPLGGPLNWAVRLGGSGYIVADADTPGEVAALKDWLADSYGGPEYVPAPTVVTPGTADGAHKGGGHWWFKLPEGMDVDTAKLPAVLKVNPAGHDEGFSLYTGNAYVLIPPSVRPEGSYHLVSPDHPAPLAVLEHVNHALTKAAERAEAREEYAERAASGELGTMHEQVAEWSSATPWSVILDPAGWTDTGTVDSCGCPIYTAPGAHSSPKSATAHEADCADGRYDIFNPPLHVWTDNPGDELAEVVEATGSKTISRLNVYAALHHGGDMAAALTAAGIEGDPTGQVFGPADMDTADMDANTGASADTATVNAGVAPAGTSAVDTAEAGDKAEVHEAHVDPAYRVHEPPRPPIDLEATHYTPSGQEVWQAWGVTKPIDDEYAAELRPMLPPWGSLSSYKDMPSPEYIVEGLLEHRGLSSVIGDSGVGKSAVVLDMAMCIASGRPWHGRRTIKCPVVYVAGEGVAGAVNRMHAWERANNHYDAGDNIFIVEDAVLLGSRAENWAYLAEQVRAVGAGVVIFDTLARMATGLDENSATDMGKGVTVFNRLQRTTGAGVVLVHHTARGSSHGRGSTAIRGAVDSEVLVTDTRVDGTPFATDGDDRPIDADGRPLPGKPLTVKSVKQKNAADDEHTYVCLTARYDSVVVTDLGGDAATPDFAKGTPVELGRPRGESLLETAERVADYVARYTSGEKFPTMSDIARAVMPDRVHMDKAKAWRAVLDLAVDKALERCMLYKVGAGYTTTPPLD